MVSEASASAIVTPPVHRRAPGKARRRASWDSGWRRASRCRMEPHASQNATVQAGPLSKTMIRVTMAAKPSIGSSDPKIIQWPRAPPRQASLGRARARVRTGRACCAGLDTAPIAPDCARRILAASHGATRGPGAIGRAPPLGAVIAHVLFPVHATVDPVPTSTLHVLPPPHVTVLSIPVETMQLLVPSQVVVQSDRQLPSQVDLPAHDVVQPVPQIELQVFLEEQ